MIATMSDQHVVVDALIDRLLSGADPKSTSDREFRAAQYDLGLAWVHFPEGFGGLALSPSVQTHIDSRLVAAGATTPDSRHFFGLTMAGPTIVTNGSEELKRLYLRRMFTGEDSWCQLFSEPDAGSDLASLACRAVRDGDEWVITGQKVWNTMAHIADRGMLITRTDPNVPKHKGLTYFALDMHAPGVEVLPLIQITGEAEFNEVFLTEVRVPNYDRIGEVGEGWRVALAPWPTSGPPLAGMAKPPLNEVAEPSPRRCASGMTKSSITGPPTRIGSSRCGVNQRCCG
jgi:alkylation response protein AidB-like acyl-CoA dehydrogenase